MARWVMITDLTKCIGCGTCGHVCTSSNKVPPGTKWRSVAECTIHERPADQRVFLPTSCMHCTNPPCLNACPTKATNRRRDGIVDIDFNKCLGCGACIVACPYDARSIIFQDHISSDHNYEIEKTASRRSDRIGVCTKCNFCAKRLEAGLAKGLKPGIDAEATPSCVRYCISEALHFGDIDDPSSNVSRILAENKSTFLLEELGTSPAIYYITELIVEKK